MSVDTISTPGEKSSRERISKLPSELSEIFEAHRTDLEAKGWHQQAEVVGIFERAFDMVPDIKWTTMEDEDTGGRIWVGTHAEQVSEEQAPIERDRIRVEKSARGIVIHLYNKDFNEGNHIRLKFATSTELMQIGDDNGSLIPLPREDAEVVPFSAVADLMVKVITGPGIVRPGIGNIPSRTVFGRRDYVTFSLEERDDVVISRKAGYCNMGQYCEYYHASTLYPYRIPDLIQLTLGDLLPEKWYFTDVENPAYAVIKALDTVFPEGTLLSGFYSGIAGLMKALSKLYHAGMITHEVDNARQQVFWHVNGTDMKRGTIMLNYGDSNPHLEMELVIPDGDIEESLDVQILFESRIPLVAVQELMTFEEDPNASDGYKIVDIQEIAAIVVSRVGSNVMVNAGGREDITYRQMANFIKRLSSSSQSKS